MNPIEEENIRLKSRLANAQEWMKREVFSKDHSSQLSLENKILSFFPQEALMNFPEDAMEQLISAETVFLHLLEGEHIDGTSVILGYQKCLDSMLELYVTKPFRQYASGHTFGKNIRSPLEKSLSLIIQKKYILSLGRLYEILSHCSSSHSQGEYEALFAEFLKSRSSLKNSLLDHDFFLQLQILIELGVFGEKRHSGNVSLEDTIKARKVITGGYKNQKSILYVMASSQDLAL